MGFYYISLFSWLIFAVYFAIAATIIIKTCGANKLSEYWKAGLLAVAFIAPWTEELWIAYNFGQLCRKDAGLFINKTVEVEGYYDDTGVTRLPPASPYRFIESPDGKGKFHRVDRASPKEEDRARQWYANEYQGKQLEKGKNEWIRHPVDDRAQVIVEIDTGYAWRITTLDKPAARYHYQKDDGVPLTHKVGRQMSKVVDSESGQELGSYTRYYREAYWFLIGLSAPNMGCDGPTSGPPKSSFLIYEDILKPLRKP